MQYGGRMAIVRLVEGQLHQRTQEHTFHQEIGRARDAINLLRLAGLSGPDGSIVDRLISERSRVRLGAIKELNQITTLAEEIRNPSGP